MKSKTKWDRIFWGCPVGVVLDASHKESTHFRVFLTLGEGNSRNPDAFSYLLMLNSGLGIYA